MILELEFYEFSYTNNNFLLFIYAYTQPVHEGYSLLAHEEQSPRQMSQRKDTHTGKEKAVKDKFKKKNF